MASSSSQTKKNFFSNGSKTELFSYRSSVILLMEQDDENKAIRVLGIGQFMIHLMMHILHPIMITVCSLDGLHWPLAKDTVIFRVSKRIFVFALPGLLYGLQFPQFCEDSVLDALENLFIKFGHYCKVMDNEGLGYFVSDEDPLIWHKVRPKIEAKANEVLVKLGQLGGRSRYNVLGYNPSYQRALRMSTATKLVEDAMINSPILKPNHFVMVGTNPPPNSNPNSNDLLIDQYTAYASVNVITCLVDTIESAEILPLLGLDYLANDFSYENDGPKLQSLFQKIGFKIWKMNESGVARFISKLGPAVEEEKEVIKKKTEEWEKMKVASVARGNSTSTTTTTTDGGSSSGSSAAPSDKGKGE